MTVHHLVLFRWKDDVPADHVAVVDAALAGLPAQIDTVRAYAHGADLGLGDGRWDYGVVATFDDAAGWRTYDEHPAHAEVLARVIAPHLQDRAVVQVNGVGTAQVASTRPPPVLGV
jgi:hypothetical protein